MSSMIDRFERARTHMVDSQIRPNKVTDTVLIAALRSLPREAFVPATENAVAYADAEIRLGFDRVMPEPMVIARLVQLAAVRRDERVLVVGAGTGYGAALLASAGAVVVALEEEAGLAAIGAAALAVHAPSAISTIGPLRAGWAAHAPYDVVFIEGGVEEVAPALVAQLAPTGRMVMIRNPPSGRAVGQAVLGRRVADDMSFAPMFDANAPTLPMFRHVAGFVF